MCKIDKVNFLAARADWQLDYLLTRDVPLL